MSQLDIYEEINSTPEMTSNVSINKPIESIESIYTVSSHSDIKLKKLTKYFINLKEQEVLFDFCFDYDYVISNKMVGRIACFINYINQIIEQDDNDKKITVLIRGYWINEFSHFNKLKDKISILAKKNTINLPEQLSFIKTY